MKRLKLLLLLAAAVSTLSACAGEEQKSPIIPEQESTEQTAPSSENTLIQNTIPTDIIIEDDTLPPIEGMLRSRLTNEWVHEDVANTRPIAVVTPNERGAVPHYNLSNASILYEANVEGKMTRLLAIYEDWQDLEKIGNVRSLRNYYAYWAFEWDAFLIHADGPFYIETILDDPKTQNLTTSGSIDSKAFFYDTERRAPHNTYISGPGILNALIQKDYKLNYRGLADENHYVFVPKAAPNTLAQYGTDARSATYIDMSGCYPLTRCYFEYNPEDGLYYRSQYLAGDTDGPHIDEVTGEQLKFKNILVQNTYHEELSDGYLSFLCHDTTRDGWFFTNGKGIHVTWEKNSDYGATRYYDDNGDEIALNTGKTMICIVEDGDSFAFH